MPERRDIDPARCWIRHVRRTAAGGTVVGRVRFAAADLRGVNGGNGWQAATPERRLADDGSLTIRFANAPGEDGVPHVDRFALLTDPAYRPGEEWLELWREPGNPGDLLFVGTPVEWELSPTELSLVCADALVILANLRASDVDYWTGAAPREAFEFYTRGKHYAAGADLTAGTVPDGWTATGATPDAAGGIRLEDAAFGRLEMPIAPALAADAWQAEVAVRNTSPTYNPGEQVNLIVRAGDSDLYTLRVVIRADGGADPTLVGAGTLAPEISTAATLAEAGGRLVLGLVARGEFLHAFVNGERILTRRRTDPDTAPDELWIAPSGGAVTVVETVHAFSWEPLLARGADRGAHELPGAPPPGGLQANYYGEAAAHAADGGSLTDFYALALMPPAPEETLNAVLEGPIEHIGGHWPPSVPATGAYWSARWTGALLIDLEASDRELVVQIANANARVWIAGELVLEHTNDTDNNNNDGDFYVLSGSLRAILGELKGWLPIRIELAHGSNVALFTFADGTTTEPAGKRVGAAEATGVYAELGPERLSPIGTFTQETRYESHRDLLGQITEAFGYQWRLEPRSLESGAFPGELVPRLRVGRDTPIVVDELEGQEIRSSGSAADAIDDLLVDASGLANSSPDAPPITGEFLLTDLARDHLVIHQAYESLAEISEPAMLQRRGTSLLALRSSPAESIAARPTGRRDLVQTLVALNTEPGPLTLTGPAARMRWEPGDGVRLNLPGLRTRDVTPRQITSVAWDLTPDGIGPPTVAFRQRPRGMRALLTRVLRASLAQARAAGR